MPGEEGVAVCKGQHVRDVGSWSGPPSRGAMVQGEIEDGLQVII